MDWIDQILNRQQERSSLASSAVSQTDSGGKTLSSMPVLSGIGAPTNIVKAPLGSIYVNLSGGANTTLYIKETGGNGATGWQAK